MCSVIKICDKILSSNLVKKRTKIKKIHRSVDFLNISERRLVSETEYPLLLRVNLGPHEDVAKLYVMELKSANEICHEVAQFLRFTYAECRAIVDMFYEEEEREIERIRRK